MQPDRQPSIRNSILFWIGTLALIPLTIVSIQGYHCARQALIETQHAHMRSMLDARKTRLETMLQVVQSDLHLLSVLSATRTAEDSNVCHQPGCMCTMNPLQNAMENKPFYDILTAFSPDWNPVASTGKMLSGNDIPRSFREDVAKAASLVFSPLLMEKDRPTVLTGCPLIPSQPGGPIPGYIVGRLDLSSVVIPVLSDRNGLGTRGSTALITADGKMLSMDGNRLVSRPATGPILELLAQTDTADNPNVFYSNGSTRLAMAADVRPVGWKLLVQVDREEAFHWLRVLGIRSITTGSLTFLLVMLVGVRISRSLSDPLQQLADTATRIARGDLSRRVPPLPGREASEVGTAFNHMMDSLERMQQKLAHQASLAAIGELSSSVVHEMRNPLSSVKINLQALRRFTENNPDYRELSDIALSQVSRLENMLTELLQFGRPFQLQPEPLAIKALMTQCIADMAGHTAERQIRIELTCPEPIPPIRADREQLTRAVENLLLNAIEASPENSTVRISLRQDHRRNQVEIQVTDEGPGIPKGILPELFRPFVSSKPEGTGLGLANVRKIIQAHGGTVTGTNGTHGAVFTITLPITGEPNGTDTDHR